MMSEKMPYNCLSQFLMMVFSLMVLVIVSVSADIRDIRVLFVVLVFAIIGMSVLLVV